MKKNLMIIDGKRFSRTYAEGITLDEVDEWIERLKEDDWTDFHLQEISGAEDMLWAMSEEEERKKLRFDIYAWRNVNEV
jgi:hypothetical protein